jgi:glycerophosphoryl diester phosphodiesterase
VNRVAVWTVGLGMMMAGPLCGGNPVVIAHRGASGYLPEHTLAAKALAHAMGADFLEQDVVLSKDGVPVVLHDIHLDTVTDVAERYPERRRADGRWYALDFTVAEIRSLRAGERVDAKTGKAAQPGRFPAGKSAFQVPTLAEELEFVDGLNRTTGRRAGIYVEIKQPAWHRREGRDLSAAVLAVLASHGYRSREDPCWLQCFDHAEVKRLRGELGWQGRLLQLTGGTTGEAGKEAAWLHSPEGLAELAKVADGLGPALASVVSGTSVADRRVTSLVRDAQSAGLVVHPYTVRADSLPPVVASLDDLHALLFREAGVDGVFSDHPDRLVAWLRAHP